MRKTLLLLFAVSSLFAQNLLYQADQDYAKENYYSAYLNYFKACNTYNDAQACYMTGIIYQNGQSIDQDFKMAQTYYTKACQLGNRQGCKESRKISHLADTTPSIYALQESCYTDHAAQCKELADYYYNGSAVNIKQNYYQASYFYDKACELGNTKSCLILADMYEYGIGNTTLDLPKAKLLRLKAKRQNKHYNNYNNDHNTYQETKANHYYNWDDYTQCSVHSNYSACMNINNIGLSYYNEQNYQQAASYFATACKENVGVACYNLGLIYHYGLDAEVNYKYAKKLYKKACKLNYEGGCESLSELREEMYNNNETHTHHYDYSSDYEQDGAEILGEFLGTIASILVEEAVRESMD
jgi:TPR repeat protein